MFHREEMGWFGFSGSGWIFWTEKKLEIYLAGIKSGLYSFCMSNTTQLAQLASRALFAVGDVVEITAACMTKGKLATVAEHCFGKIEVSFSPQWCGWYLPEQLRKISSANAGGMARELAAQDSESITDING